MRYVEFARKRDKRSGTMVPVSCIPPTGYRTLYEFNKEDADEIKRRGNSRKLSQYPVYSDTFWMDFDDGGTTVWEAVAFFVAKNCNVSVYLSGGKGYHVGVEILPMEGKNVPQQQKHFAKTLPFPCDLCLYQHGRLFRNIGMIHEKTKQPKRLLYQWIGGKRLEIPQVLLVEKTVEKVELSDTDVVKYTFERFARTLEYDPSPGMRHTTLWSLASSFCEACISFETALELNQVLNKMFSCPKEPDEVERAVRQAYNLEEYDGV